MTSFIGVLAGPGSALVVGIDGACTTLPLLQR
jgi:hypothetical protein